MFRRILFSKWFALCSLSLLFNIRWHIRKGCPFAHHFSHTHNNIQCENPVNTVSNSHKMTIEFETTKEMAQRNSQESNKRHGDSKHGHRDTQECGKKRKKSINSKEKIVRFLLCSHFVYQPFDNDKEINSIKTERTDVEGTKERFDFFFS